MISFKIPVNSHYRYVWINFIYLLIYLIKIPCPKRNKVMQSYVKMSRFLPVLIFMVFGKENFEFRAYYRHCRNVP